VTRAGDVRAALEARDPIVRDPADYEQHASVALVVAPEARDDDLQLLFIRRRKHHSDPWSGHTALPGGRIDPGDAGPRAAAERETLEEVGVDLTRAELLGRLDDLTGKTASLVVSCFVYGLVEAPRLVTNYEVDDARFMPFAEIESPERHTIDGFRYLGQELVLPAIQVFDPPAMPLWGLTYRFLEIFMHAIGRPIPPMPWDESL
jgi:8-oxo-dGTP pyrophosphatase MutT (NUDIX family)